jgi:hypothetical protein
VASASISASVAAASEAHLRHGVGHSVAISRSPGVSCLAVLRCSRVLGWPRESAPTLHPSQLAKRCGCRVSCETGQVGLPSRFWRSWSACSRTLAKDRPRFRFRAAPPSASGGVRLLRCQEGCQTTELGELRRSGLFSVHAEFRPGRGTKSQR